MAWSYVCKCFLHTCKVPTLTQLGKQCLCKERQPIPNFDFYAKYFYFSWSKNSLILEDYAYHLYHYTVCIREWLCTSFPELHSVI